MNRTPRLLLSASIALWALPALAGLQPNPGCDLSGTPTASALDRGDASFRAKRAFVWDGDTLVAETGLNFEDAITWRRLVLPGPSGLDDAPLVRVEANLQGGGSPDPHLYAVVRDELGSVIGVLDQAPAAGAPALRARVLYTPYGEAHLETGPEPLRLWFDPTLTAAGGQTQQVAPPEPPATESEAIPGGLRLTTTARLDPASVATGLGVERYYPASGSWTAVAASAVAAGPSASEETELDLVLLAGWPKGGQIRITLRPQLADGFGRAFQVPAGEDPAGVRVVVTVPASGSAPDLDRRWPLRFDSGYAAANSLGGAFPDGQTSLYQGLWTDPVTGIAYARARWYDARNASWLSEDPVGTFDSPNLYAFVAHQPHLYTDPEGEAIPIVIPALLIAWGAIEGAGQSIEVATSTDPYASMLGAGVKGAAIHGGITAATIPIGGAIFRGVASPLASRLVARGFSQVVAEGLGMAAGGSLAGGLGTPMYLGGTDVIEAGILGDRDWHTPGQYMTATGVGAVAGALPGLATAAAGRFTAAPYYWKGWRIGGAFAEAPHPPTILSRARGATIQYGNRLSRVTDRFAGRLGRALSLARADHHSHPKYLGGAPDQDLTTMLEWRHTGLHRRLNRFLDRFTEPGRSMVHSPINSSAMIQRAYSPSELEEALAAFYRRYRLLYWDAASDFFSQHPGL